MEKKVIMDVEEISKINNILKMYIREEQLTANDILNKNNRIINYYRTKNSDRISNLNDELHNNFSIINRVHNNNIIVFNKTKESYIDDAKKTVKSFKELKNNGKI